jgi:hypothetical protein
MKEFTLRSTSDEQIDVVNPMCTTCGGIVTWDCISCGQTMMQGDLCSTCSFGFPCGSTCIDGCANGCRTSCGNSCKGGCSWGCGTACSFSCDILATA